MNEKLLARWTAELHQDSADNWARIARKTKDKHLRIFALIQAQESKRWAECVLGAVNKIDS